MPSWRVQPAPNVHAPRHLEIRKSRKSWGMKSWLASELVGETTSNICVTCGLKLWNYIWCDLIQTRSYRMLQVFLWFAGSLQLVQNRKTSHCRLLTGSLSDTGWSLEQRKTVGQLLHLDSLSMPSSPTEYAPRRSPPWNGKHWWTTDKASNRNLWPSHNLSHV